MAAAKLHIKEPCHVNWNHMSPDKDGRFCHSCQKTVIDFSSKNLDEISAYLAANKDVCGRYQARHVTSNGWHNFMNRAELFFARKKMAGFSVFIITVLLFFSSCIRHVQGKMSAYQDDPPAKSKKDKHKVNNARHK